MVERSRVETQVAINLGAAEQQVRQVAQKRQVEQTKVEKLSTRVNEVIRRLQTAEQRTRVFQSQTRSGIQQITQQVSQLAILEGLHLGSSILGGAVQPLAQIGTTTAFAGLTMGVPGAVTAFIFTSLSQMITVIRTMSQKQEAIFLRFKQLDQDLKDIDEELRKERFDRIEQEIRDREQARFNAQTFTQEIIWRTAQVLESKIAN